MEKRFTFDFNLNVWIKDLEIYASSKEEAIKKINKMSIKELIKEGDVKGFDIDDWDIDEEEDYTEEDYKMDLADRLNKMEKEEE